jgi:hypothetical protein
MRKILLLGATLAALAVIAEPASAHGYGPAYPAPTLGVHIVLVPAPRAVQHYHYQPRHIYPAPVRHFGYRPQRTTWHGPWQPGPRHLDLRRNDQPRWHGADLRHDGHQEWRSSPRQHDGGHGRGNR